MRCRCSNSCNAVHLEGSQEELGLIDNDVVERAEFVNRDVLEVVDIWTISQVSLK